jgi:hypothetical protein
MAVGSDPTCEEASQPASVQLASQLGHVGGSVLSFCVAEGSLGLQIRVLGSVEPFFVFEWQPGALVQSVLRRLSAGWRKRATGQGVKQRRLWCPKLAENFEYLGCLKFLLRSMESVQVLVVQTRRTWRFFCSSLRLRLVLGIRSGGAFAKHWVGFTTGTGRVISRGWLALTSPSVNTCAFRFEPFSYS